MTARWRAWLLVAGLAVALVQPAAAQPVQSDGHDAALLIVAVKDRPEARALPGATPRAGYRGNAAYAGSDRARALAAEVAAEHLLAEVSAWTINALDLRCMLYRLPAGADRAAALARLQADPRVQLAQPLNGFDTLASPPAATAPAYNDPYLKLQQGFASIQAGPAQRWSRGERVRVAVIDTGIDGTHPDLAGRLGVQRDFAAANPAAGERHGTQVAGVIAAGANNGVGIVGVAPAVELLGYRACWNTASNAGARCNSFTLAQALGAAITAGADVINLSLGGPPDPLLERLALHALARGSVIVAALPASGRREGFPSALPGVLVARASETTVEGGGGQALAAPGRQILTLLPGGAYDFASGSSLAAAHLSGAVALLRSLDGGLRAPALQTLLQPVAGGAIDACAALQRLRPALGAQACAPAAEP